MMYDNLMFFIVSVIVTTAMLIANNLEGWGIAVITFLIVYLSTWLTFKGGKNNE